MITLGFDYSRILCPLSALNFPFAKSPLLCALVHFNWAQPRATEKEFHPRTYLGQVGQRAMPVGGSLDC